MNELLGAIRNDNYAQIIELLEQQSIDQPLWYGFNALLYAVNQEAIIALLLRYNANPNILDLAGSSPIDEAKRRNLKDIILLLSSKPS